LLFRPSGLSAASAGDRNEAISRTFVGEGEPRNISVCSAARTQPNQAVLVSERSRSRGASRLVAHVASNRRHPRNRSTRG